MQSQEYIPGRGKCTPKFEGARLIGLVSRVVCCLGNSWDSSTIKGGVVQPINTTSPLTTPPAHRVAHIEIGGLQMV